MIVINGPTTPSLRIKMSSLSFTDNLKQHLVRPSFFYFPTYQFIFTIQLLHCLPLVRQKCHPCKYQWTYGPLSRIQMSFLSLMDIMNNFSFVPFSMNHFHCSPTNQFIFYVQFVVQSLSYEPYVGFVVKGQSTNFN